MKIDDLTKESETSTDLIPKLEEKILELQRLLQDQEKILEDIKENYKGNLISFEL